MFVVGWRIFVGGLWGGFGVAEFWLVWLNLLGGVSAVVKRGTFSFY